jgi:hypothetical protein
MWLCTRLNKWNIYIAENNAHFRENFREKPLFKFPQNAILRILPKSTPFRMILFSAKIGNIYFRFNPSGAAPYF